MAFNNWTSTKTSTISCYLFMILYFGFTVVHFSDAIVCYQCGATSLDSPCYKDFEGLTNTSKGWDESTKYKKNCTDSNPRWDRCFIQQHSSGGKVSVFSRGCHDGIYFNDNVKDYEFQNLTANNESTCAYVKNSLVCFRFCNSGHFCNGPIPEYDKCDLKNTTEIEVCAGHGLHDRGWATLVWNSLIVLVVWCFAHK